MSQFYNPQRSRNLYNSQSHQSFKLSRSKIELFVNCPRCFYLDRKLGVGQPPGYPFALNSAVDKLLKKEFDVYRKQGKPHPLMQKAGIEAVPFDHPDLELWRANTKGITYLFAGLNLCVSGAIDDVWINPKKELHIVDYKSTAKDADVTINEDWQVGYKRQMEIYQWLFRKNGFKVSQRGYFVYCNGILDREAFEGRLDFSIDFLPYDADDSWVEQSLKDIYACLQSEVLPPPGQDCDYCKYREAVLKVENAKVF